MTKQLPSLALDMSQDGIALHQLAFDGHWHELARVALTDPALRARLTNMRSIAAKLEGRRFKTRIWLPQEQIMQAKLSLMGVDDKLRLAKARAEIASKFGGKPNDYVVQLGKRAEGGAYPVAAVRVRTMQEARTFAKSHGFAARGYSTQTSVEGFAEPPNFTQPADKVKSAGLGLVAATAAAAVLGGGFAFIALDPLNLWETPPTTADFAPFQQPNPSIERATAPALSQGSDVPIFPVFTAITSASAPGILPYLPPRQLTADALELIDAPVLPPMGDAPEAPKMASAALVNWPASIAPLQDPTAPDPLPSIGLFSVQDSITAPVAPEAEAPPPAPSGPMVAYRAPLRPTTVANTSFYLEPLPAMATRLSPDALAAFVSRSGLSLEQLSRMSPPLLLAESKLAKVIPGQPPLLPALRSGRAIPVQAAPPDAPVPVVAAAAPTGPAPLFLVVAGKPEIIPPLRPRPPVIVPPEDRLPYRLVDGAPDIRPRFRPEPEVVAPAADPGEDATEVTPPAPAETLVAEANAPEITAPPVAPLGADNAIFSEAINAAILSAAPQGFALLEGQPALLPRLRSGAEIPALAPPVSTLDPATIEANNLRPRRRPQAVADLPAPIDPMISSAAPLTAIRPNHRTDAFAANAARIIEISASRPRATAPPVPSDPRTVNLPTSASVARAATIENAINLRKTNLIGIYGSADNRTALIMLSGGRMVRVQHGQSFSGWTVVAVSENSVRIRKRNREEILRMPAE